MVWMVGCLAEIFFFGGGFRKACLSPDVTVMHQEGACGWQMKWDRWKVRFEVECGSSSNAVLPSHLSTSKPGLMKAVVIKGSSPSGGTFTHAYAHTSTHKHTHSQTSPLKCCCCQSLCCCFFYCFFYFDLMLNGNSNRTHCGRTVVWALQNIYRIFSYFTFP